MTATIGGYVLEARLGEGGMGTVYRATHPRFPGHAFAVKVIRGDGPPEPESLARFQRETQALARATAHPNIVRLLGAGVERDTPYYVMELVPGVSLAELVTKQGPLEAGRAARLVREVAAALAHAHSCGVLHRDLKPENVIVSGEHVRVCDFGLAKIAGAERLTRSNVVFGTPAYSAPEQLAGLAHGAGPPADVYALGAVLAFLLTGELCFEADSLPEYLEKVAHERPVPPSAKRAGVPRALDAIVLHALEKEPSARYPSAKTFLDDMERFLSGSAVLAPMPPRRRAWLPLVAVSALAVVTCVGALAVIAALRGPVPASSTAGPVAPVEPAAPGDALLAALERSGGPREALGCGRVTAFTAPIVSKLVLLSKAPGGAKLALLAADALVCGGRDEEARACIEPFRDEPAARSLRAVLDAPRGAEGYVALVGSADPDPVRQAALLQRFFARCGAPGAIDDAALAAVVSDSVLERLVDSGPSLAFDLVPDRDVDDAHVDPLHHEGDAMRRHERTDETTFMEGLAAHGPTITALAKSVLHDVGGPRSIEECIQVPQLGLDAFFAALVSIRHYPDVADWLAGAIDPATRKWARTGIQEDLYPADLELDPPAFDAAVDAALARSVLRGVAAESDLEAARGSARALKRLDLIGRDDVAGRERLLAAGDALIGLETFVRLAGPGALPFRARLRALALPGVLGKNLARLDDLRIERAIDPFTIEAGVRVNSATKLAFVAAALAPEAAGGRDVGGELYRLAVAWACENYVAGHCRDRNEKGFVSAFSERCSDLRFRPHLAGLGRWLQARDFVAQPEDRRRVASGLYEFKKPTLAR